MDEHLRMTGGGCRRGSEQMLLHVPSGALSFVEEEACISHYPSMINFTEGFPGAAGAQNRVSTWCWWGGLRQLWGKTTPTSGVRIPEVE